MGKRNALNVILEQATKNVFASNYPQAICLYEEALKIISVCSVFDEYNLTDFDICVINYSLCNCYVTHEKYFQKASDGLIPLVVSYGSRFPTLYYGLAKLCFAQHRFQQTESVIRNGLKVLSDVNEETTFRANWPGTDVQIPESNSDILIRLLKSLERQCFAIRKMESSDVYQSDEFEDDEVLMLSDNEENAQSLEIQTETGNLPGDITNQNELLNKSDNAEQVLQIEDITNLNVTKKRTLVLNVDVPEFVPRNLKIGSSNVINHPVINIASSNCAPETKMSSAFEDETISAPKMTSEINNTAQSPQFHDQGCQTNTTKMIEKSIQTKMKPLNVSTQTPKLEHTCNCKQQITANQLFKQKLSSVMDENQKLHQKVENLQEENEQQMETLKEYYKQNFLQDQQKILVAENSERIASLKLEGLQDKLVILEAKIKEQENKIDHLTQNNQMMNSVTTTQSMQYFSLQEGLLTEYLNKCRKMVFDLTVALPYLSVSSIPSATICQMHIKQWEKQLEKAEHCLALQKNYHEQVTKDVRRGNFTDVSSLPEYVSQLAKPNDILHDSFLPAINCLLKENKQYYQQILHFQQQYSQWWNTYGLLHQPRPAVITALPHHYKVPQAGSSAVQISDVTATSATRKPVAITSPNTIPKSATDNSNAFKNPEMTEPSTSDTKSITDISKSSQHSSKLESSTLNINPRTNNAEEIKQYEKTAKSVSDNSEAAKEYEREYPSISPNSNASKEDENLSIGSRICDIKVKNVETNQTDNSDNSKVEQEFIATHLSTDSKQEKNITVETKPSVKPFTIASKEKILGRSILYETEEQSASDNVISSTPLQSSKDHSSNSVPLLNLKQTQTLINASSLVNVEKPDEHLAIVQATKVDNSQPKGLYFGSAKTESKQDYHSFSVTENYKNVASSSSRKFNDDHTPASISHLTQEVSSTTSKEVTKNVDYSQLPDAVRKAGRSFCDLYLYVKERLPENTETEIFSALKRVRRKNTKLSGLTKDSIVAAVRIELKISQKYDGNVGTSASSLAGINSEATGLEKNHTQTMCIVCYEGFGTSPLSKLSCQHVFHKKCITQWFIYKNDCPVCRVFVA